MPGIQPVDLGGAALRGFADRDHACALRFDRVPDQRGDVGAAEAFDLLDAGGRGDVDLGHIVADHVDAGENQPALLQFRADGGADRPVRARVSSVASGRPPTCMLERASPAAGTRLMAPANSPSTRMMRLSPWRTSGR